MNFIADIISSLVSYSYEHHYKPQSTRFPRSVCLLRLFIRRKFRASVVTLTCMNISKPNEKNN